MHRTKNYSLTGKIRMETELPHSSHRFSTWDVYPRISHHRSRFKDMYSRFKKVMGTIPEGLHDRKVMSELQMLNEQLDMDFVVNVFGRKLERRDIAICEMFEASPSENLGISIDVIILEHDGVNETEFMNYTDAWVGKYFRDFQVTKCQEIVLFCETHLPMSELTFEKLYSRLITTLKLPDHLVQMLHIRRNSTDTLKAELSDAFERWIEKGFSNVELELNRFTPRHWPTNIENSRPRETTSGWMSYISDGIRQYIRDSSNVIDNSKSSIDKANYSRFSIDKAHLEDDSEEQEKALASRIRCISVGILSSKFILPQWVCNALLLEIGFEKNIILSISKNTRYHLRNRSAFMRGTFLEIGFRKNTRFDFLSYKILEEIKPLEAIEKYFSMMNRTVQVMKRMRREVCQTMKEFWERNEQLIGGINIAEKFDIRRTNGGNQTNLSACRLRELKFGPQQGDQLLSPVPGNRTDHRMGTLGCFVKGKNGQIYAVTCAHVVEHSTRNDVSSKRPGQSAQPLGTSSPELTLSLHSGDSPFDDIAAVEISPDISEQCNLTLMNDKGQPKPALLATEPPEVGTYVYKIGAKTGLTTGVVAESNPEDKLPQHIFWMESCPGNDEDIQDILDPPNDHSLSTKIQACNEINKFSDLEISCCSSQQYAQITDEENELPDTTTEKTKTDNTNPGQNIKFAEQGDSGAIVFAIVTTIYAELIIVLSMISGGDYESRDGAKNSHEKECMSFLLKTELERLGLKFKNDPEFFDLA